MKSSHDLWFNAFLLSEGFQIARFDVFGRNRVECFWDLDENKWREMKLKFQTHELMKFKGLIEQIRDLGF